MTKRNRRAGVEDLWHKKVSLDGKTVKQRTVRHGKGSRWRARYVDDAGSEHSKAFAIKAEAQAWLDQETAAIVAGKFVAPRNRKVTVQEWCATWLGAYAGHRPKTVEGARTHIQLIVSEFGDLLLSDIRPSHIMTWTARLSADYAPATIARVHSRLSQILEDAVHDNLIGSNPCSRRTSPPTAKAKLYVLSTEQVWALHAVMPDRLKVAVLLGAFAGLRVSEACGLRESDIDIFKRVIHPKQQYGGKPLKTAACDAPIPVPRELINEISASLKRYPSDYVVTSAKTGRCHPVNVQLAVAAARDKVHGLPDTVTFHDLRHFYASMLIARGVDLIRVQHCMRHASATTTLRLYAHLLPGDDEVTNEAVSAAMKLRRVSGLN